MASSVDISGLTSKLQEFVADNPKIWGEVFTSLMGVGNYIDVYEDVEDQLPLIKGVVNDPVQPGNRSAFAPKNNIVQFTDRILTVKNIEITLQFKQAEIEALKRSYINKIARMQGQGATPEVYSMPFEEYMMMRIIERSADQIRKNGLYLGVLDATGTTSSDLFDGYLTLLAALVAATTVPAANVFAGAAITGANGVAQFEGVKNKLMATRPDYQNEDLVCIAAPENWDFYAQNYRSVYTALPYNTGFEKMKIDGLPTTELISEVGMIGSDRIILTPRYNLVLGTNSMTAINNLIVEREKRDLNVLGDAKMGVNFVDPTLVWTNDQT